MYGTSVSSGLSHTQFISQHHRAMILELYNY